MVPKMKQFEPIKYESKNSKVKKQINKNGKRVGEDDTESSNSEDEKYLSEYFWDPEAFQEI